MCMLCPNLTSQIYQESLSTCPVVTVIPFIQSLRVLDCRSSSIVQLPVLPNLAVLYCKDIDLDQVVALPALHTLVYEGSSPLPSLPHLESLECDPSTIGRLPHLPELTVLDCGDMDMDTVAALPKLTHLNYRGTELATLPMVRTLEYLSCEKTRIRTLPAYPKLEKLDCYECPLLVALPSFPRLVELDCHDCVSLLIIGECRRMEHLDCDGCTHLASLPFPCPQLRALEIDDCRGLFAVPIYPKLHTLSYNNTPLTSTPFYPDAYETYADGCPWLAPLLTENIPDVIHLQRWTRRCLKRKRFIRLITSRAFNEFFFAPDQKGGQWNKRRMEQGFGADKRE